MTPSEELTALRDAAATFIAIANEEGHLPPLIREDERSWPAYWGFVAAVGEDAIRAKAAEL